MWAAAKRWSKLWTEKWPIDLVTWKSLVTLNGNRNGGEVRMELGGKKKGPLSTAVSFGSFLDGREAGLQRTAEAGVLCKGFFLQKQGKSGCWF